MNLVSPISETTSSPILRSLMSFCFPDPVVIKVSKPKHPFSLTISVLTGISPRQNMLNFFLFNFCLKMYSYILEDQDIPSGYL